MWKNNLSIYLVVTIIIVATYIELSHFWVGCGGFRPSNFYFEIPFVFFLLLLLYFPNTSSKNNKLDFLVPVIPILSLYLAHDIFYSFLGRSPRISDINNASTLLDFSPELAAGFVVFLLLICLPVFFIVFRYFKQVALIVFFKTIATKGSMVLIAILPMFASDLFLNYQKKTFNYISWSQERTIKYNGRFACLFYYQLKEKEALKKLQGYIGKDIHEHEKLYPNKITKKRNVYIVVLESFIDPRLLKEVQYNRSPLADEIMPFLKDAKEFSYCISPVYGGGTAQAEFEILTGIKAYAKIDAAEFNVMSGYPMISLVSELKDNNYSTVATIATDSMYYNSKTAYKSIGFERTIFLEEDKNFKKTIGDDQTFDGDLFEYSLRILNSQINVGTGESNQPILSYILGMYGHFPYNTNLKKRPDVIETSHEDERIKRISNQFYYRTKALGQYIEKIVQDHPYSIIYITSDHLPPILNENIHYRKDKFVNISILLIDGNLVDVSGKHYYEIPYIIWDALTEKNEVRNLEDGNMESIYFKGLSESIIPQQL